MIETAGSARLSGKHFPALDGLRGMAIAIVLFHHCDFLLPNGGLGRNAVKAVLYLGWTGVDLFFVLSGFLITGILVDTKASKNYFSSFYVRRVLRIFPLYFGVLSVIVIFDRVFYQPWFDQIMAIRRDQIYYFLYLDNWMFLLKDYWHGNIIGHFWSLAVEEQFYLIWPLCIWLIPGRRILKLAITGCVLAFLVRLVLVAVYGPSQSIVENTFARMDALLAGAGCAMIVRNQSLVEKVRPLLMPAVIATAAGIFWIEFICGESRTQWGQYMEIVGFTLLSIGYAALLLHVFLGQETQSIVQRLFASGPMQAMGKYSYGIYVLHVPILTIASRLFGRMTGNNLAASWAFVAAIFCLSFVAAKASYNLFEKRFLKLKKYFAPKFELQGDSEAGSVQYPQPTLS